MHTLPSIPDIPSPISPPRPLDETPSLPNGRNDRSPRSFPRNSGVKTSFTICVLVFGLILCICTLLQYFILGSPASLPFGKNDNSNAGGDEFSGGINGHFSGRNPGSLFDELGRYVIDNYDAVPTFSDFLPGVAGIYGKPIWSFYVNRGQGIASFGVKSKDYPIMEFQSANNAYQSTALLGFRTFYKGHRGGGTPFLIEPFDPSRTKYEQLNAPLQKDGGDDTPPHSAEWESAPTRTMYIGSNEMQIREVDHVHRIETNVTYFTLSEEDFGALVRKTTITNTDKEKALHLSILDGLARMQPVGGKLNGLLKSIGRTLEGWMGVYAADGKTMPFYRLSTEPADTAAVVIEEAGHYCLSFMEHQENELLPIIYDTTKVFGGDTMLLRPMGLYGKSVKDIIDGPQYGSSKTSSAFAAVDDVTIYPGQSITLLSFYGRADRITDVPVFSRRINQLGFPQYKLARARELVAQITSGVETVTSNELFDKHVQQMYLDNSLRGGIPVLLGEIDDRSRSESADDDDRIKVYHLFSRVHGDLERDYNNFVLEPTYFSQGPGNFRDVAQNRRNDVVINPRIGSFNVKLFLSFLQADGYNPLSVEAVVFTIEDKAQCERISTTVVGHADGHRAQREALALILCDGPFRPGQLMSMIEEQNIILLTSPSELIDDVAATAEISPMAVTKDGFWADHWTYYIDLVNSFLQIYPEKEESLLYDQMLPYFFSPRIVRPRAEKYVLSTSFDGFGHHVRQLDPSYESPSRVKKMKQFINNSSGWFEIKANYQHDVAGNVFKSTPIAKLFLLATLKFSTRDPYGMGIEYEGGKPGWNDAMNGLVGMVGSGLPETYELKVLLNYIQKVNDKYQRPVTVPKELASLIGNISDALDLLEMSDYAKSLKNATNTPTLTSTVPSDLFQYWDSVATAREYYREVTNVFSGKTHEFSSTSVAKIIERWIEQVNMGIERAMILGNHGYNKADMKSGITPTYFSFNITKWELTGKKNPDGHPFVRAKKIAVGEFPLFLEGVVRMMKTIDKDEVQSVYEKVKASGLRDKGLGMYTLSSSLVGQSYDMGRMMAFSPGWLENQSVWMHMSYKYYLELIRKGLYTEFFDEMKSGMLPFINDETYGRSLLECSSFIASSAFVDPSMRGKGFLARLSGSTAEFLSMWVLMMIGPNPFFMNNETGLVEMQLVPALPSWLFREDPSAGRNEKFVVQYKLFTSINVVYYISESRDLFGVRPMRYEIGLRDGSRIKVDGPTIPSDLATNIRRVVFIDFIHAWY